MSTGSRQEMDLDGFLGHTTRGPASKFLDGWKTRKPPLIKIVLHTKAPIIAVWQHAWPRISVREKDGKDVREVWSNQFNSWETEEVLKNQYKRDDSGMREHPPQICPMSIMLEEVYRLWKDGSLNWDTVLFRFVGDDVSKAKVLRVAHMLNQVNKIWENLSEKEKRDAKDKNVDGPMHAWKSNMLAKCNYVFTVVEYDKPGEGIQIARETTLVGDKMKKAIRDRMTSEGEEKGHPFRNPYVFQWKHDESAKEFNLKYDVIIIGKDVVTEEIRKLVVDTPPPDLTRYTNPGDITDLRTSMEDAYCGPEKMLDWDFIFGRAEALQRSQRGEEEAAGGSAEEIADEMINGEADAAPVDEAETTIDNVTEPAVEEAEAPATEAPPPRRARKPAADPKYVVARTEADGRMFAADGVELLNCEETKCQVIMRIDEAKCRNCGTEYEIEAVAAPATQKPAQGASPAKPAQSAAKPAAGSKQAAGASAVAAGNAAKAAGRDKLPF